MMKKILIVVIFILGNINAQEIEGRWIPGGFANTMYEFVDTELFAEAGLRYTYYCSDENGCDESYWYSLDTSDAIPNPNPYSVSVDGNTLSIDTFFGNISTYELGFRCDGQVVDFYYDEDDWVEGLHSTMYRLGFDDFNNDCLDANPGDCICNEMWEPVCGIDGNTYSNACFAECEYIVIAYEGECLDLNPDDCEGLDEGECWYAEGCEWEESDNVPDGGSCVEEYIFECSDLGYANCIFYSEFCEWIESDNVPGGGSCIEIDTIYSCSYLENQETCESNGCTWTESDNLPGGGGCFDGLSGDVNLDDNRDVLDVVLIVSFILGNTDPSDSEFQSSDMNFDGELNVLDVVSLVNSILGLFRTNDHLDNRAILDENILNLEGPIGGIQFTGNLISNLDGNDVIASNNGKSIIYNLNGILKTTVFTFKNAPNDLIVSSSSAQRVNVELISPAVFMLNSAYPNPFNPSTTVSYSIEKDINVNISIYNMSGQKVSELVNANQTVGNYSITWDASNQPSGLYFVRMSAGNQNSSQKIMLVK